MDPENIKRNLHPISILFETGLTIHNLNKEAERRFGLSIVQWHILKHLLDLPATSAYELAKAAGVHPSTLTQSLKRLEKKAHVFVDEDPKDSRKKLISITRQGKTILDRVDSQIGQLFLGIESIEEHLVQMKNFLTMRLKSGHG